MLPREFKPEALYDLVRLGRNHDGGYLVEKASIEKAEALVSFGISDDWSFEQSFLSRKEVPLSAYDPTTTQWLFLYKAWKALGDVLILRKPFGLFLRSLRVPLDYRAFFRKECVHYRSEVGGGYRDGAVSLKTIFSAIEPRPVFLKMDIEGDEHEIFDDLIACADQCCGLVIEIHDIHLHRQGILDFLRKYPLTLVHIHPNNYGAVDSSGDPCVCEFTFAQFPDAIDAAPNFPHRFDQSNTPRKKDLPLNFAETDLLPLPSGSASHISVVIIFREDMQTLPGTLQMLREFGEILIYDNGPTPDLDAFCSSYPNIRIERGLFTGFGPTRNYAANLARFDWILAIDADERLDADLYAAIAGIPLDQTSIVYRLRRRNYYLGKRLRFGAWSRDKIIRLYHRNQTAFNQIMVHEKVLVPEHIQIQTLPGFLEHAPISSLHDHIQKFDTYSGLPRGVSKIETNNSEQTSILAMKAVVHGLWSFFRSYILFLGLFDGWRGLACAWGDANGRFYKYMKRVTDRGSTTAKTRSQVQPKHSN